MNFRKYVGIALLIVAVVGLFSVAAAQDAPSGDLEIFSWWAGGGEGGGHLAGAAGHRRVAGLGETAAQGG